MTQRFGDPRSTAVDAGADDGFSIDILVERLDGDEEIAREVALAFVDSSRELLQQLDAAIADGRADAVRLHAHSLKGAAANIGADASAEAAAAIENAGREGRIEAAEHATPLLHERIERVFAVLESWS